MMAKTLGELDEWIRLLRKENHPLADTLQEIAEGWRADVNKECPGMSKHTPGPWKYEVNRTCDGYEKHIIRSEAKLNPYEGDWVCACGGMKEGDGHLIAAAPRMKKALEEINELTLQDGDPELLLEKIRIEAVKPLRECEGEQG